jgi:dGTPase
MDKSMTIRERTQEIEASTLSSMAVLAKDSKGRAKSEDECPVRTAFQRDRDRVVHSKAFRRLKDKTQVFIAPEADHFRTRLTHTLEVCQIARTIARGLRLNEDLTEAIALGHDLGHTPFGHAGEDVLDRMHPGGFSHNEQSLRVVDFLEGGGLNLTWEVRDGILNHPWKGSPVTAEGRCVQLADRIAYVNHDIDDALRGGVLEQSALPAEALGVLGATHGRRINTLVTAAILQSLDAGAVTLEGEPLMALDVLRTFLFQRVYVSSAAKKEEDKARGVVEALYRRFRDCPGDMPESYRNSAAPHDGVRDYVAGMTDRFAIAQYRKFFVPKTWNYEEI